MINVYENCRDEIVGVVSNKNEGCLDIVDSNGNYFTGSQGHHLGLTQLENDKYVLIYTNDWGRGEYGILINNDEAFQRIMKTNNSELLDDFPDLKKFYDELLKEKE